MSLALKEMARLMRVYHRKYKECINQEVVVKTRPFTMTDLGATRYGKSARMIVYAQNHKKTYIQTIKGCEKKHNQECALKQYHVTTGTLSPPLLGTDNK